MPFSTLVFFPNAFQDIWYYVFVESYCSLKWLYGSFSSVCEGNLILLRWLLFFTYLTIRIVYPVLFVIFMMKLGALYEMLILTVSSVNVAINALADLDKVKKRSQYASLWNSGIYWVERWVYILTFYHKMSNFKIGFQNKEIIEGKEFSDPYTIAQYVKVYGKLVL